MASIPFRDDDDDEDEELMAFDLKKKIAAALGKQHQGKDKEEERTPLLPAEAATPSPGVIEKGKTATGGRQENAPRHEQEEEEEEEGDEYDRYEKMAEIVVEEAKPSSLSQFCWATDRCQVRRPCIVLGKDEASVFEIKPGHEVVFFFALGRKAQYCSQCTKDELQQYNSGDSGETRAWSSGLVEEGRQQYHGPREAWDKMMAEAEKALKEFIRREEEWNAVGGGSGAPCGDEVSSDEDKDVEEEDKKVGSSSSRGGSLLEGVTNHACLQRGDRIMWYRNGRVDRVSSNIVKVKDNPDKEDYPLEVHNHINGPNRRDKVSKVAEWKGAGQHKLEVPINRVLYDFHLLTRMNQRHLPLDIVLDTSSAKVKKMLARRNNDVIDKFNELFCGETRKKRARKDGACSPAGRGREASSSSEMKDD